MRISHNMGVWYHDIHAAAAAAAAAAAFKINVHETHVFMLISEIMIFSLMSSLMNFVRAPWLFWPGPIHHRNSLRVSEHG